MSIPFRAPRLIVPLVTPFGSGGGVDRATLEKLVDYAFDEGASALMPTALTGEGPLLSEVETFLVSELLELRAILSEKS